MIQLYILALAFALFSIGMAGVASTRHFLIMVIFVEVALSAAALLAVLFLDAPGSGYAIPLLFSIWGIAAAEVMALIAFYRYMVKEEVSLDVSKLSRFRG